MGLGGRRQRTVYLTSAQAAVYGGGQGIDFAGGAGNAAGLYSTGGAWDWVGGAGAVVYLDSAQAAVYGGGDGIDFTGGTGNAAGLYSTGGSLGLGGRRRRGGLSQQRAGRGVRRRPGD